MKHLINKNTGATLAVDDKKALELMKTGMFEYISKEEFKNKPDYLQAGITQWIPVESSNLNALRYSPKTQTLFIRFGQPKAVSCYKYENVPENLFLGLLNAESKGKFFWQWIRPFHKEFPYNREW